MIGNNGRDITVAFVEPICGHGGMDYYDYALLRGLILAGVRPRFYTSEAGPLVLQDVHVSESFRGVFGREPKIVRAARWMVALWKSIGDASRHGAVIAHFHLFLNIGRLEEMGLWLAKLRGMKVVATMHDIESLETSSGVSLPRCLLTPLDGMIVHNRFSMEQVVRAAGGKKITVKVIPHGHYIDYVGPSLSQGDARERLGLSRDGYLFLFFGHVKKVKGLDVALRAIAIVKRTHSHVTLLVAGKLWKSDRADYDNLIHSLGIERNVVWHEGHVPSDKVDDYYSACNAVLLPYRKIYQSGVLLMAMSYGVPVIASDLPGMKEIIQHGVNGLLFREGDCESLASAMLTVLSRPSEVALMARRGLEHVRKCHGWENIGKETGDFYGHVLDAASGKGE